MKKWFLIIAVIIGVPITSTTLRAEAKNCRATKTCVTTTTTTTTTKPTTTTTVAPTTTTTVPSSGCTGVAVSPGPLSQTLIDAYPTGTTFCFAPGDYTMAAPIRIKSYDRLISTTSRGAHVASAGATGGFIGSGTETGQHDILVQGFDLSGFIQPACLSTCSTYPKSAIQAGWRWTVSDNTLRDSSVGLIWNQGSVIDGNLITHNERYGAASNGNDVTFTNNELSWNNYGDNVNDTTRKGDSGGTKFVGLSGAWSDRLTITGNYVHDNIGHGIWLDGNNRNVLIDNNTVVRNSRPGDPKTEQADIFYEVSDVGTISNNTAGIILLNDSMHVNIFGNTTTGDIYGTGWLRNDTKPDGVTKSILCDVHVYNNTIGGSTYWNGNATQAQDCVNAGYQVWSTTAPATLIFADEFNGTTLDLTKWHPNWFDSNDTKIGHLGALTGGFANCLDPADVSVSGGYLHLSLSQRTCTDEAGHVWPYAGAMVNTHDHFTFTYGTVEARVYFPPQPSTTYIANWPGMWSLNHDQNADEIDIVEGWNGCGSFNYHTSTHNTGGTCATESNGSPAGWHIIKMVWTPTGITVYHDGAFYASYTENVLNSPQFLIFDNEISTNINTAHNYLPTEMLVDWVRVST